MRKGSEVLYVVGLGLVFLGATIEAILAYPGAPGGWNNGMWFLIIGLPLFLLGIILGNKKK